MSVLQILHNSVGHLFIRTIFLKITRIVRSKIRRLVPDKRLNYRLLECSSFVISEHPVVEITCFCSGAPVLRSHACLDEEKRCDGKEKGAAIKQLRT